MKLYITILLAIICCVIAGCGGFDFEYRKQPPGSLINKYGFGDPARDPSIPGVKP